MIKGFKEFVMRGNVIELAIAVVIGTAFQKMVDAFVSAIIKPALNVPGGAESNGFGFSFSHANAKREADTFVDVSAMLNSIIVFLLTAAVVYLMLVLPMNKIAERRSAKRAAAGIVEDPEPPTEQQLLSEIRDLLKERKNA